MVNVLEPVALGHLQMYTCCEGMILQVMVLWMDGLIIKWGPPKRFMLLDVSWHFMTSSVLLHLKTHKNEQIYFLCFRHSILACSWHPAGSYILSSEKQKKIILWSDI